MRYTLVVIALAVLSACASTQPTKIFEDQNVAIYRTCVTNPGNWTHTCSTQLIRKDEHITFQSE